MDFFERVKQLCKDKDMQLNVFISGLGINYDSYKSLKRYNNLPRADEALKIAKALGTTIEYLVDGTKTEDEQYKSKYENVVKIVAELNLQILENK